MKNLTSALALAAALCAAPAFAASHKEAPDMKAASGAAAVQPLTSASEAPPTAQQSKMATCNKDAADKKGADRKAFMKECLSAKKETQQNKMKTCNADAKGKKGDERKAFMKECLTAKAA
jgi:hypothetical protein